VIQKDFNSAQSGGKKVSLADLIVLGGCAAVEAAAKKASHEIKVPFSPGRMDTSQELTDVNSFAVLEPAADGFRNYVRKGLQGSAAEMLVDKAHLMTLTAPEMTVLIGGLRALNANVGQAQHGVFTKRPETLTNDFFVNLLDMSTKWQKSANTDGVLEGRDRATGELKWTGTVVDLVFGSNSQFRALAEVYACSDSQQAFLRDFVAAWNKVMNLDRYELAWRIAATRACSYRRYASLFSMSAGRRYVSSDSDSHHVQAALLRRRTLDGAGGRGSRLVRLKPDLAASSPRNPRSAR
jgi:catalase-peroxidase